MNRIEIIKNELIADPAGKGYASMTAQQAADAMNAKDQQIKRDIEAADIKAYLVLNDLWLSIKTSTTPEAELTRDALQIFEVFRVTDPNIGAAVEAKLNAVLDGLINAGLITAAHKSDVLSMMWQQASRAEILGLGRVLPSEINEARAE